MHSNAVGSQNEKRSGTCKGLEHCKKSAAARSNSKITAAVVALISNAMTLFRIAWQVCTKEKRVSLDIVLRSLMLSQTLAPGALSK